MAYITYPAFTPSKDNTQPKKNGNFDLHYVHPDGSETFIKTVKGFKATSDECLRIAREMRD